MNRYRDPILSHTAGPLQAAIPDHSTCLAWLHEAGASNQVVSHAQLTAQRAMLMASQLQLRGVVLDERVVLAGALLHDLGRALVSGPGHALAGAEWLRARGCPEAVACCVERHILAGLSAKDAAAVGLPARDFVPRTIEEKVVAHSDNLTGKKKPRPLKKLIAKLERRGSSLEVILRILYLDQELRALAGGEI